MPDLSVELCGLRLPHPVLLGSGGLGESAGTLARFQPAAAAVCTRTLRRCVPPERATFPSPHLAAEPRGRWLLNAEWGNLRPLEYWLAEGIPQARRGGPVIASVSGRDVADCVETCRLLDGQVPLLEVNVSCSHAGYLFGRLTDDAAHVAALVRRLKREVGTPVAVKLGWSPGLAAVARAAAEAGADAIATTNSIGPGLDLDLRTGRPVLGTAGGVGGLSGRAIFPLALQSVHEVVRSVDIPVIGIGGIASYRDAVKMIMVGATCVEVYTAAVLRGPAVLDRIVQGLRDHLDAHGLATLGDLRGAALPHLAAPTNTRPRPPVVDEAACRPCGRCAAVCPADAIAVGRVARIDPDRCTGCGLCVGACPPQLDALRW